MLLERSKHMVKQTIRFSSEITNIYSEEMAELFGNKSDAYRFAAQYLAMEMGVIDQPPEVGYSDRVEKHLDKSSAFDETLYDAFAVYTLGLANQDERVAATGIEKLEEIDNELAEIAEERLEMLD